ncbi:MAG: DUF131 domain-containing protein [Desulfurococcales archaeon]|nr:DUF131 domain-containing protein [Desulfurococcales archaeon]
MGVGDILVVAGIILVFLGVFLVFIGFLGKISQSSNVEAGGVVIIGPLPIVFGSSSRITLVVLILAIILTILTIILYRKILYYH